MSVEALSRFSPGYRIIWTTTNRHFVQEKKKKTKQKKQNNENGFRCSVLLLLFASSTTEHVVVDVVFRPLIIAESAVTLSLYKDMQTYIFNIF